MDVIRSLDKQRINLKHDIRSNCIRDYEGVHDMPRAKDLLRTYTCSIFDILKDFYRTKGSSLWSYEALIIEESVQIALKCWTDLKVNPEASHHKAMLVKAISLHLASNPSSLKLGPALAYLAPSPSDAPLIAMAKSLVFAPITTKPQFAVELKALLREARWKPETIAEEINISPRNVYRHLKGETEPSLTNIGAYESALSKKLKRTVKFTLPAKRQ